MKLSSPLLFAIKRYALHDGPNIRTTIFFKGCPLHCFWCHNPEGIDPEIEIVSIFAKCIGCRECIHGCPEAALSLARHGLYRDSDSCSTCLGCVEICPALAHEALGYHSRLADIMKEIEKDLPFFDQSGGGVTFSGGEPLMQAEALINLLKMCGRLEIHRAVDTTGFCPTSTLLEVANNAELFLFDLKQMDSTLHKKYTGVPNELILYNLKKLAETCVSIRIRIPLLAGINDDDNNIQATAEFTAGLEGLTGIDVLPYHHFATAKYLKIGEGYHGESKHTPTKETLSRVQHIFEHYGHTVRIGG